MSASQIAANRNSTPDDSKSSLRPPSSRASAVPSGHSLHASADLSTFLPLVNRGVRPSSEVYLSQVKQTLGQNSEDIMESAAQKWIADIDQYETTLEEMAAATLDQDFKDELGAIEQWFRVLCEAERTAALYALLQQTTQVQIRFFIQVLQQMAKNHPASGVLSPSNFGEKDPMSQKMTDAMNKLTVEGSRSSIGLNRAPPSPNSKWNSGLDPKVIQSLFPDAAAAIAKQKAEFTQTTGTVPPANRNSAILGDRSSLSDRPTPVSRSIPISDSKGVENQPSSPWDHRSFNTHPSDVRPKSSGHQPMGQFVQPPPSGGLRSPLPLQLSGDSNIQNVTLNVPDTVQSGGMPIQSPYDNTHRHWASMVNTPTPQSGFGDKQAEMVANATAMKLAAFSTLNGINLDDARQYRRTRSSDGRQSSDQQYSAAPVSPGLPQSQRNLPANILMTNEHGQVLTPQQAATLQAQQLVSMNGHRSRPTSPGLLVQPAMNSPLNFQLPQNKGFLSAYDTTSSINNNPMQGVNLNPYMGPLGAVGVGAGHYEGYLSDNSDINRGRSPRGRRGSSKAPEDSVDKALLEDIPSWLRSLRLHKYTENLRDLKWTELIELDDEKLEKRGVNAMGARRKMLKVFQEVKKAQTEGKL